MLRVIACLALLSLWGCGSSAARARRSVTVVVSGHAAAATRVRSALSGPSELPIDVRLTELPNAPLTERPPGDVEARLAAARRAYVELGDFVACLERLSPPTLIRDLLGVGSRRLASRVLLGRVACHVGDGDVDAARREATSLAVLGLSLDAPEDVVAQTPQVQAVLDEAGAAVAGGHRATLRLESAGPAGVVSVDGTRAACRTPCAIDLPQGEHVVRLDADGFLPELRTIRLEAQGTRSVLPLTVAGPDLAGRQWTARYASSVAVDSAPSVRLLSRAVRARRLVLLDVEERRTGLGLQGVVAVDGRVAGREQRTVESTAALTEQSLGLLRDLLLEARVVERPPLVRRLEFWLALTGTALLAAGVTGFLLYDPPVVTEVVFEPRDP